MICLIILFCKELSTSSLASSEPTVSISQGTFEILENRTRERSEIGALLLLLLSPHKKIASTYGCKVLFERGTAIRTLQNQVLSICMQVQI